MLRRTFSIRSMLYHLAVGTGVIAVFLDGFSRIATMHIEDKTSNSNSSFILTKGALWYCWEYVDMFDNDIPAWWKRFRVRLDRSQPPRCQGGFALLPESTSPPRDPVFGGTTSDVAWLGFRQTAADFTKTRVPPDVLWQNRRFPLYPFWLTAVILFLFRWQRRRKLSGRGFAVQTLRKD